jgi:PAT family beta-lactamase induction signal transducer AmpG
MNEIEAVGVESVSSVQPQSVLVGRENERPWLYSFLIGPSAVVANGVIQGGVLAYLLNQQHVGSKGQSHLIDLLALPTSLYFLWSPITDFFVRRRTWLLIGGPLAAITMAAGFHQQNLTSSGAAMLMLLSACFSQLAVSSCGGMMGAMTLERPRRVASSFYQAGSMGFGALAAWMLIKLSYFGAGRDALGFAAAAMIGVPSLLALAAPPQHEISTGSFGATMKRIGVEFKATFWRLDALPYAACMVFPMASGAAISLLSGSATQWGVSGNGVAWMSGLGAVFMAAGSASAATLPVRMRAPVMYMILALVNCATLCVLWLGPMRPSTYYLGVTLYLFTVGICYAMFTAVVLEFLGHSGKSGSGRYSIINSLGNVPVLYMIALDGWGGDRWGARGLAGTEAVVGAIGASILLIYFVARKQVWAPEVVPVEV